VGGNAIICQKDFEDGLPKRGVKDERKCPTAEERLLLQFETRKKPVKRGSLGSPREL